MEIKPTETKDEFCDRCTKKLIKKGEKHSDAVLACEEYYYITKNKTANG